jgi:hypothetical protein
MTGRWLASVFLLPALLAFFPLSAAADEVVLRDGERLEGEVLSLDDEKLVIRLPGGERRHVGRERVERILLKPAAEVPPIRVEVKNLGSDDALDVWLNDDQVIAASRISRDWIDLTDLLRDGSNEIRATVHNKRGSWSYRWALRVQGKATTFECGIPNRAGCTEEGQSGDETGEIELRSIWVYLDRDEGRVEIER